MLELDPQTGLPVHRTLAALLGTSAAAVARRVESALLAPIEAMVNRPSKKFRAELLRLGFLLGDGRASATPNERTFALCTQAIELLHAGSMIVDDIQDGSTVRRGAPTLHRIYGVPGALCAGNWLYFWPLRLIRDAELPKAHEQRIIALYCDAVERAHYGQAVDLSVRIDDIPQAEVAALVDGVTELKTGSVTALAMSLGAVLGDATEERVEALAGFGLAFGSALQHLDDLGNLVGRIEPEKRYEDLLQAKPSAIWAEAAGIFDPATYREFGDAVARLRAGESGVFEAWVDRNGLVPAMREKARKKLATAFAAARALPGGCPGAGREALDKLEERLLHAYC